MAKSTAQKVREYMEAHPTATTAELAQKFKVRPNYIYVMRCNLKKAATKARKAAAAQTPKADGVNIDAAHDPRMPNFAPKEDWKTIATVTTNEPMPVTLPITMDEPEHDPVSYPVHYTDGGIETIDFIEAKGLGYHLGNAVKYISRAGKKGTNNGLEDLRKAQWYISRAIEKNEYASPSR